MPELPELNKILYSGELAYGTYTKKFEEKLKEYFCTPYIIVTNSFNTAIFVAITTLGLTFGDEIIASPMACLASTQPYLSIGMKIKWCDVDPKKGTLEPECLRKSITTRTKAIIHNHFCGYPGYINEINAIALEYGIPVIDDGIECFGSEYKGKKIGNCGTDVTVFSLSAVRIPNTIEGGIVIFKDKKLFEKSLRIRDCGIDRRIFRDELGEISPECDITEIGYSATMSNVNGYIGLQQMKKIDELLSRQRKNAAYLDDVLLKNKDIRSIKSKEHLPNYWVYGMFAENRKKKINEFRNLGLYASGIHTDNSAYSVFGDKRELEGTKEFCQHYLAIPSGWWVDYQKLKQKY